MCRATVNPTYNDLAYHEKSFRIKQMAFPTGRVLVRILQSERIVAKGTTSENFGWNTPTKKTLQTLSALR